MDKNKRPMRFSDEELQLIKNTFADNFDLLVVLRKHFLQLELTEAEKQIFSSTFKGKTELLKLLRKIYLPEIEPNAPLHQVIDLWMTVKIDERDPRDAVNTLAARELVIQYLDQQLNCLNGECDCQIKLDELVKINKKNLNETVINITARNTVIQHTEFQLAVISNLAGQKQETVEETKKRLMQDSSK